MREHKLDNLAKIVAGAHDHEPAMQRVYLYMRTREIARDFGVEAFLIKNGTYQEGSSSGYRHFHIGGMPWFSYLVLDPVEHRKECVQHLEDAVALRKVWRKRLSLFRGEIIPELGYYLHTKRDMVADCYGK